MIRVFILGGTCRTYLGWQVEMIREHVQDLEEIIWVTGPTDPDPEMASSRMHVRPEIDGVAHLAIPNDVVWPALKRARIFELRTAIYERYSDGHDCLTLHADCIPFVTVDKNVLCDGREGAWLPGVAAGWHLSNAELGGDFFVDDMQTRVNHWGIDEIEIGRFKMAILCPCFLHLDDISLNSDEVRREKLHAAQEWYRGL